MCLLDKTRKLKNIAKSENFNHFHELPMDKQLMYLTKIKKEDLLENFKNYIEIKIKGQESYVNSETSFNYFNEELHENNMDAVMDHPGGFEDFNLGFEQGKRSTYFEILNALKSL